MNCRIITTILVMLVTSPSSATRSLASSLSQSSDSDVIELKLSDLRSAYLIREGAVHYDAKANSPGGVRAQLQRHFDVVIGILLATTPRSMDTAVARLEATDNHTWSKSERADWRRKLAAQRYLQLRRLTAYRDRGLFPLNEGQASHPVPIFVDEHDTACAVGHLMRLSGWQAEVADIQNTNNLVYVPDAPHSAVAAWVLTSGLTREEAALVQPAYGAFYASEVTSNYEPGELSFIKNGLKYENFHVDAQNYESTGVIPIYQFSNFHSLLDACNGCTFVPTSSGPLPQVNNIGVNAGADLLYGNNFDFYDPTGTHWINLGGLIPYTVFHLINGSSSSNYIQRIRLNFDVSTVDPSAYINQISEYSYPTYGGFDPTFQGDFSQSLWEFTTVASDSGSPLSTVHLEEDHSLPTFTVQSTTAGLGTSPNHLSVASTVWLFNGARVDGVVLAFNVVPEPTSCALFAGGLALIASAWVRRGRRGVPLS